MSICIHELFVALKSPRLFTSMAWCCSHISPLGSYGDCLNNMLKQWCESWENCPPLWSLTYSSSASNLVDRSDSLNKLITATMPGGGASLNRINQSIHFLVMAPPHFLSCMGLHFLQRNRLVLQAQWNNSTFFNWRNRRKITQALASFCSIAQTFTQSHNFLHIMRKYHEIITWGVQLSCTAISFEKCFQHSNAMAIIVCGKIVPLHCSIMRNTVLLFAFNLCGSRTPLAWKYFAVLRAVQHKWLWRNSFLLVGKITIACSYALATSPPDLS